MKNVFYFNFSFDEYDELTFGFIVEYDGAIESIIDSEAYSEHFAALEEKYGIHDWSSAPVDGYSAIGYTTYEVEHARILLLMQEWADWFTNQGATTSKVVEVLDWSDDASVYEYIKGVV